MTYTVVRKLTHEEKINEIARMLGGIKITDTTLQQAKEFLEKF
jgi:DNA repair protein RecN (Recombination protein N)